MDYLYGKLNKEVEQNSYKGSISDTIKINIDDSTNVISGELVNNYFNFKIYDNLPAATEKTYLTFAVLDNGNTQSLYICLKHNDVYIWEQAQNLNCYYFDDLESTFEAINSNIYSEDNKEQLSSSVVRIITGLAVPIIDILADVTMESDLSISKSCIINLNGHTVTINNDGRLKFINSTGPTEVIINAADAIIQRAGTQSAAKCLITFMGQSLTINGGSFKEYNSRDNAATVCSPLAVNCETAKIYIYGARLEAAGRYRGFGAYLYKFSSFEASNSTFIGGALQASKDAYSEDQAMGIGILADVNNQLVSSKVKLNKCVCSGECMAANVGSELEAVGTTFESCDHGLYVANLANLQSCTLAHKNWSNLIAAKLQYPFKDGETKVKTQYSETHAEYANLGLCYIGSSDNNATAIMNNCLEQTDSEKNVHIVLSTNYGYKAPSLYLSNHTVLYSIRVDPDRGKGAAKLYVGDNVSLGETVEQFGYVDKSSYRGISFNNEFDVCEGLQNQILQVNEKLAAVYYAYAPDPGGYFEKDTIGGQLQELGAGKVNRSTGKLKVYATDKDGNTISSISYSIAADANTFPLRDSNGNIKVGTPVEDEDAVPKSYADEKLDKITTTDGYNRAYGVSYEGNQMSFRVANSALASTLAQRDSNGNIKVGTPVNDGDATSKSYVDALKQSTNPNTANTAGHIGQLCLVGSSDVNPYDVYICVMSNPGSSTYVWHKMCTTEAPA